MGKNIKKSIKYIIITTGIIIILPTLLFSILRFHRVQTYIAQQVAAHFSEELKSTISIGSLEYTFFNKINFKDILIKDQHNDTMIYSRRATISVQNLDLKSKKYGFGRIELVDPVISLITDTGGMMNLNWYLDKLKGPGDSTGKSAVITIREIDLNDARFNLIDKRDTSHNRSGINFSSINLKNINGIAESFRIENDTTKFNIYNLSFNEKSGFNTKRLNTEVKLAKNNVHFDSMKLLCDSSIINLTEFDMRADSSSSFKDFINDVNLNLELEKSLINTGELSYFVPALKEFNETIWLSGRVAGTIAELRGRDINMEYGNFSSLDCDFDISGLPSIENSFIYIGISNLKVSTSDIDGINIPGKGPLVVPEILRRIETLSFDGSFTGFTTDFVAYGNLRTRYGTIRTDISLRPKEAKDFRIKGLIQASGLALGELAGNNDMFGNCSFSTNVDGIAESFKSFSGAIEGLVDSIEINNYKYRKINLNGEFSEKAWDGTIKVSDQNILLDLLGKLDFGDKLPKFDFTLDIKKANLYNLYFDKKDTTSSLSALITANFIGNNIDNIDGKINVINSNIIKYGNPLELNNFSINTFSENNKPAINLRTDFIDVDIRGYYSFSRLGTLAKSALASIMPAKFYDSKIAIGGISNNFNFSILFKNTDKLNDFFKTGIYIASKSSISGEIAGDSLVNIRGNSKEFVLKNNVFHDVAFTAHYEVPNISLNVITSSLTLIDNSILKDFNVNLLTQPDTFNITAGWDNKETVKNMGNFIASGKFYNNPVAGGKPLLKINVDSSEIYINNNLWKINRSDIIIDSTAIDINKVNIRSKDRFYLVDGKISENQRDTLTLQFNGIDISPLNYILFQKTDNPDQVSLSLHGILSGKLS